MFNGIMIRGNAVGDVMFYGQGAGALPTASAVVGDVLDALAHREKRRSLGWSQRAELADVETELPMRWYLRGDGVPADKRFPGRAYITPEAMTAREAKALAQKTGVQALLPVLD